MVGGDFIIREATGADMAGIARVRTSVRENLLTSEQLAERGITNASVAASLLVDRKGWLAERAGEIVAFSMADRENGSLFALFVLPEYEGRGLGSRLLDLALQWLWDNGTELRLAHHLARHACGPLLRAPQLDPNRPGPQRRHPLRASPPR